MVAMRCHDWLPRMAEVAGLRERPGTGYRVLIQGTGLRERPACSSLSHAWRLRCLHDVPRFLWLHSTRFCCTLRMSGRTICARFVSEQLVSTFGNLREEWKEKRGKMERLDNKMDSEFADKMIACIEDFDSSAASKKGLLRSQFLISGPPLRPRWESCN